MELNLHCARCGRATVYLFVSKGNLTDIPLCVQHILEHERAMGRFTQIEFTDQITEVEAPDER